MTVSQGGYPRGYITEPQNSSFRPSASPDLSPDPSPIHPRSIRDPSLGVFLDLPAGLSLDPVRFRLPPLWPWRGHTPECGVSATLKATILTRTRCAVLKRY
jgi:hypothetical protein